MYCKIEYEIGPIFLQMKILLIHKSAGIEIILNKNQLSNKKNWTPKYDPIHIVDTKMLF